MENAKTFKCLRTKRKETKRVVNNFTAKKVIEGESVNNPSINAQQAEPGAAALARRKTETTVEQHCKEQTDINISETYDEIFDLGNYKLFGDPSARPDTLNNCFVNKLSEFPKCLTGKQLTDVQAEELRNALRDEFDAKTNLIVHRIVEKQRELEAQKSGKKAGFFKPIRVSAARPKASQKAREPNSKKVSLNARNLMALQDSYHRKKEAANKAHFLLSTHPVKSRCWLSRAATQVNFDKPSHADQQSQTEEDLRDEQLQTEQKRIRGNVKKVQTRMFKRSEIDTSPWLVRGPEKYTNTADSGAPICEQGTQMYEHVTRSDLFCLEWVNRYLFSVSLNPNSIVVDDRIKEISEIVSTSTFINDEDLKSVQEIGKF